MTTQNIPDILQFPGPLSLRNNIKNRRVNPQAMNILLIHKKVSILSNNKQKGLNTCMAIILFRFLQVKSLLMLWKLQPQVMAILVV